MHLSNFVSCVELGTLSQESLSFYHKKCKAISSTTQVPFLNPQEVLFPRDGKTYCVLKIVYRQLASF